MLIRQLIFILCVLPCLSVNAEVGTSVNTRATNSSSAGQCTSAQRQENIKIINYCNSNWGKWGINPLPPPEALRSENECSGLFSSATASGCADALMALPVFIFDLGVDVFSTAAAHTIVALGAKDKNSEAYVFQNGTEEELQAFLSNKYLRERCGLGPNDSYLVEERCPANQLGVSDDEKRECRNRFVAEYQRAQTCHRSSETRRAYRENQAEQSGRVREILRTREQNNQTQQRTQAAQSAHDRELRRIKNKCSIPIIANPTMAIFQIADRMKDNGYQVQAFNACVEKETANNPSMKTELLKRTDGWIRDILGEANSLQCYNERERRALQCELTMAIMSGGGALTVMAYKKLGPRAVQLLQSKGLLKRIDTSLTTAPARSSNGVVSGNRANPRGTGRSTENVRSPDEVARVTRNAGLSPSQKMIGAEKGLQEKGLLKGALTPAQKAALLRADEVGASRPGAGVFNYTREERLAKGRILMKDNVFTKEQAQFLMDEGYAGLVVDTGVRTRNQFGHIIKKTISYKRPSGYRSDVDDAVLAAHLSDINQARAAYEANPMAPNNARILAGNLSRDGIYRTGQSQITPEISGLLKTEAENLEKVFRAGTSESAGRAAEDISSAYADYAATLPVGSAERVEAIKKATEYRDTYAKSAAHTYEQKRLSDIYSDAVRRGVRSERVTDASVHADDYSQLQRNLSSMKDEVGRARIRAQMEVIENYARSNGWNMQYFGGR